MQRARFKLVVIPPLSLFLLAGLGWLVRKRWPVLARWLIGTAVALLYVLSVPLVSAALARSLQRIPALDLHHLPAGPQAIVVLGADFSAMAPEYGGATVGMMTLERLRYAAVLHRATGLPVLTCGGPPLEGVRPLAFHMAETLEQDFATPVEWIESGSATTRENLRGAAELLNPRATGGVRRIYLVTHVWHLPRARFSAEAEGFVVTPAGTGYRAWPPAKPASLLPSARALRESAWAVHEWIGRLWYLLTR
jgi:uncharacterized SAM-binding protein YcdF (DUF218 family)